MFSSFSTFSLPSLPRILGGNPGAAIDLKSVDIHDVEIQHEKRARTLKHLLKLNHANHAILYHHLQFDNHTPHVAYLLGASAEHLDDVYEKEHKELEPWIDSPGEISTFDWRDYLGDRHYQRAFVDFFEDQMVLNGYDWKLVVSKYLFEGSKPLINCLIGGLGHPLIHLGYAYELSSREVAMEALGLVATTYTFFHKYLDDASYTKPSTYSTSSPVEILQKVAKDKRFDNLFDHQGADNIEPIFENHEAAVLEHWNAWQLPDPKKQFEESQHAAVALLVATHGSTNERKFDFFLVHVLTTTHAVRILLPIIPAKFHVPVVRQWWLLTLAVYIAQVRPAIDLERITGYDVKGKDWAWVEQEAVGGKWSLDAHYVKGLRAMKEAAKTWGDADQYYLKAACKFGEKFDEWGGFGPIEAGARRGSATGH
ncbi:cell cycle checkpoint protein, partial [Lecanoromycetidae sp. Uapishka_2]